MPTTDGRITRPASSASTSGRPSRYRAISELVVPRSMPTMMSFTIRLLLPVPSCSSRYLVHHDIGGPQHFPFPEEAGAHLPHHDAVIHAVIRDCPDRAGDLRVERLADDIDRYDAALAQYAVEPVERHPQPFPPGIGGRVGAV